MSSSGTGGTGGVGGGAASLPWTKHFASPSPLDYAWGVAESPAGETVIQATIAQPIDFGGGLLVPSGVGHNVALAKLDASGKHIWSKVFTNTTDADPRILLDDAFGNLFLIGAMQGNFDKQDFGGPPLPQGGNTNIYAAKLDANGNHVWSKLYYSAAFNNAIDATLDADQNLLLVGALKGTVNFGNGPVSSNGSTDIVIAKIKNDGTGVWAKTFGDPTGQGIGWAIATDSARNVVAVGQFSGTIAFGGAPMTAVSTTNGGAWIAKLDKDSKHVWSRGLNNTQSTQGGVFATAVAEDTQGNTIVAGGFSDDCDLGGGVLSSVGVYSGFIAKYDPSGNHLWSFTTGLTGPAGLHAIEISTNDEIVFNAALVSSVDFGCGPLKGSAGGDTALARLSASGTCIWSEAITDKSGKFTSGTTQVAIKLDSFMNLVVYGSFGGTITFGPALGGATYTESDPGNQHADIFLGKFKL